MQISIIKQLTNQFSATELREAEHALMQGEAPGIEVEGVDDGEQLTHVLGALWIIDRMNTEGMSYASAQREFIKSVRGVL
jgi:hypothetical protein